MDCIGSVCGTRNKCHNCFNEKYQNLGIGKKALELLLEKIKEYPNGDKLPVALEVKEDNKVAMKLYQSFGFYDTGIRYEDDCAFVKLPD